MYTTCLYCHSALGRNDAIEAFPVGRQLAFDAAQGRLWAVCTRCGRWNLSPLDERFEAIETCERFYRQSRLRASSGNIGLARLSEGLELVRIGEPDRVEFAAWRYGREFARRRDTAYLTAGAIAFIGASVFALRHLNPALYGLIPAVGILPNLPNLWHLHQQTIRGVARFTDDDGRSAMVRGLHVSHARLVHDDGPHGWALAVQHTHGTSQLSGHRAERVLGNLMAHVNRVGGSAATIARAASHLAQMGDADRMMQHMAATIAPARFGTTSAMGNLAQASVEMRLAVEMALHEDTERDALRGQLDALRDAWKDAEEIAAIADGLLLPSPENRSFD